MCVAAAKYSERHKAEGWTCTQRKMDGGWRVWRTG